MRTKAINRGENMDNKLHFIFTSNKKIRENLVRLGFSEIPSGSSFFMFLNDSTLKFDSSIPIDKIGFTNKLMF